MIREAESSATEQLFSPPASCFLGMLLFFAWIMVSQLLYILQTTGEMQTHRRLEPRHASETAFHRRLSGGRGKRKDFKIFLSRAVGSMSCLSRAARNTSAPYPDSIERRREEPETGLLLPVKLFHFHLERKSLPGGPAEEGYGEGNIGGSG